MSDFSDIIGANFGEGDATPAHVFEYETITIDAAPAGLQQGRQWALLDADGNAVAIGPVGGGMKSAFIAYAAQHPGYRVANRRVTLGDWQAPTV